MCDVSGSEEIREGQPFFSPKVGTVSEVGWQSRAWGGRISPRTQSFIPDSACHKHRGKCSIPSLSTSHLLTLPMGLCCLLHTRNLSTCVSARISAKQETSEYAESLYFQPHAQCTSLCMPRLAQISQSNSFPLLLQHRAFQG